MQLRRHPRHYKVYIFCIRINGGVELAMSVCLSIRSSLLLLQLKLVYQFYSYLNET